jgi:protein-tyrosine phosphatase family protein
MIKRLRMVVKNKLYRGGAPRIEDIIFLNKKLGVKKIISLDEVAGKHIDRACKLLGIQHIMLPIDISRKGTLLKFLRMDLKKLFLDGGPTFIHCEEGKDRTGLAIAMFRCEDEDWTCEEALKEAKKLGFGLGVAPSVVHLYEKLINKSCGCTQNKDNNAAYDISSNQREYPSNYRDYTNDAFEQMSWSDYQDYRVREFPYTGVDIDWPEQYDTRITHGLDDSNAIPPGNRGIPQMGTYDTSTNGIMGAGPSLVGSGYV